MLKMRFIENDPIAKKWSYFVFLCLVCLVCLLCLTRVYPICLLCLLYSTSSTLSTLSTSVVFKTQGPSDTIGNHVESYVRFKSLKDSIGVEIFRWDG